MPFVRSSDVLMDAAAAPFTQSAFEFRLRSELPRGGDTQVAIMLCSSLDPHGHLPNQNGNSLYRPPDGQVH
jgi:hypothetical protein